MAMPSSVVVFLYLCFAGVVTSDDHPVPTFFWRKHPNGTLVDRRSPEFDEHLKGHPVLRKAPLGVKIEPIKLTTWPSKNIENGDKVTVLWSGVTNPQPKDWIGYYCPFHDSATHHLDYVWIKDIPGHAKDAEGGHPGYGHVKFTVYNMRKSCQFKFFRQVFKDASKKSYYYVLAASGPVLAFTGGDQTPTQGHIALTKNPTQMRVMWVSGLTKSPPHVKYGRSRDALALSEYKYITHTYTADMMCEGWANSRGFWEPGITYDILLTNLEPNTKYYYSYGSKGHMSEVASFTTPLPRGDPTPFNFVVFGDMGVFQWPQSVATARWMLKEVEERDARFIFHVGDISYARGWAYIWEQWGKLIEPYATRTPYMVGIGNHEYDHMSGGKGRDPSGLDTEGGWKPNWSNAGHDSGGECGVPMYHRYHMPETGNSLFWYSYDFGLVHMIMMSTEHDFSPNSTQYKWLENDLKRVNRSITPWVILGGHRPMYNSEWYDSDYKYSVHMKELFEDLLYKYGLDIAVYGHYHAYERTCAVYKEKCVADGVIHITVGNAGMWRDRDVWYGKTWSVARKPDYGYGRVAVANSTSLLFEVVINRHGEVYDHVWLHK